MENIYGLSFPKAGRTWLRLIIAKIYAELTGSNITNILQQEHGKVKDYKEQQLQTTDGSLLPHILFKHGPDKGRISQEKHFPPFYQNKKAFVLVRNPLDVVVSFYYHKKYYKKNIYKGTLQDFVHYPYQSAAANSEEARFGLMPIINYMNTMIENKDQFSSFQTYFYEDLINQPLENIRKLMQFCIPFTVDDSLLQNAINYCTFENMRKMEQENTLQWHALPGNNDTKGMKTRKGKKGGYKTEFSANEIEEMQLIVRQNLNPFYERYY